MSKLTIAIDIDDVLSDSTEAYRRRVNEVTGADLTPDHYRTEGEYWGYYERIWAQHGLEVDDEVLHHEMVDDQSRMPLVAGAEFAIGQLSSKYSLVIVTARDPSWESATRRWLDLHFGSIYSPDLYFSEAHKDEGKKTKGQICKELGASWLIDDNVNHCKTATDEGVEAILFGKYGWHYDAPKELPRCETWFEVLEYFDNGRS